MSNFSFLTRIRSCPERSRRGAQFTATAFTATLEQADILISIDGRGRDQIGSDT